MQAIPKTHQLFLWSAENENSIISLIESQTDRGLLYQLDFGSLCSAVLCMSGQLLSAV